MDFSLLAGNVRKMLTGSKDRTRTPRVDLLNVSRSRFSWLACKPRVSLHRFPAGENESWFCPVCRTIRDPGNKRV